MQTQIKNALRLLSQHEYQFFSSLRPLILSYLSQSVTTLLTAPFYQKYMLFPMAIKGSFHI